MTEDFSIREMLEVLMGPDGKRKLRLRHRTNEELFALYDSQLVLKHRSREALEEARRLLGHYCTFLGQYPPSPELAAAFLAESSQLKPNTLYRYHSIIQSFQTWYGEPLDSKIKVPQTLPEYVEDVNVAKLEAAMASKKTHKKKIERNLLIILLIKKTGLRRLEVASLRVGDVDLTRRFLIVRLGKGMKDRIIDLAPSLAQRLEPFLKGRNPDELVFGVKAETISGIIRWAAIRGGVDIHTHSLRDYFAERLVDKKTDLEIVRRLMGHANLNNTQKYLGRTDGQRRHAIESLDLPDDVTADDSSLPGQPHTYKRRSDTRGTWDREPDDLSATQQAAVRAEPPGVPETSHKATVRRLAAKLAGKIALPSLSDKELWRQLPLTKPGTYYLELGAVTVAKNGRSAVRYESPSTDAPPHLGRSLSEHLRSSASDKFSRLAGEQDAISKWASGVGRYSDCALLLLDEVIEKITACDTELQSVDIMRPGLTKWFAVTAWHDLIMTGAGHKWLDDTWYQLPEKSGDLYAMRCGAFPIDHARTRQILNDDLDLHRRLRSDPDLAAEASRLKEERRALNDEAGRLRQALQEFSDLEFIPGRCALCASRL